MLIIAKGKIFFRVIEACKKGNIFQYNFFLKVHNNSHFSVLKHFFLSSELMFKMHISIKHQVGSLEGKFSQKFSFKSLYYNRLLILAEKKKSNNIAPRLNEVSFYFMLIKPKMHMSILNVTIHQ